MSLLASIFLASLKAGVGSVQGRRVFYSDMTFNTTINPAVYENGEAVFIDTAQILEQGTDRT